MEFIEKETDNPNALHISCPHTYEGIGIKRNFGNVVTQVAPGWPADKAGIKPGDSVEPWSIWPENGYMEFELIRDGVRKKMRLKTAQICFRDGPF